MKLTLIKDLRKDYGDKNCLTKTFDCSPYVLLDKKVGETIEGKLLDKQRVQLIYGGTTFVVDKSYFKDFNQGSNSNIYTDTKKSNTKLYIGIGAGVLILGVIGFFIIKNK
jgi:hypothetical protein